MGNDNIMSQNIDPKTLEAIDEILTGSYGGEYERSYFRKDNPTQVRDLEEARDKIAKLLVDNIAYADTSGRVVGMHELEFSLRFEGIPLNQKQIDIKRKHVAQLEAKLTTHQDTEDSNDYS